MREICPLMYDANGGRNIEHSGGFSEGRRRRGILLMVCWARAGAYLRQWPGNRVTIDVLPGRPLGPLTLLIIGSITMPHTQTNIHRKRNTPFIRFFMIYPGSRFFQENILKYDFDDNK